MMAAGQETLNFEATELRLGRPDQTPTTTTTEFKSGSKRSRTSSELLLISGDLSSVPSSKTSSLKINHLDSNPTKTQIVGWPPVRSYRKNNTLIRCEGTYVKVNMDGAPYLRKIDLKAYYSYKEMVMAIQGLFKVEMRDEYIPTYQDKDGDWMLVGDVPWYMFVDSCKRLRIIKSSDAKRMLKDL